MNYRIILSERPGTSKGLDIDFDKTILELFVEIDNQIYRVSKSLTTEQETFSKINEKKNLIGRMFIEVGEMLI